MSADVSADEFFESLTGFEEIAISKNFGDEWQDLMVAKPIMFLRALAFIQFKRRDYRDAEAKQQAMNLTVKEANEFFVDDEDEIDESDPETESGKGDTQDD